MNTIAQQATTMIHAKVPKQLRDDAKTVANELGVSLSLVVEQALRSFAATKRLVIEEKPLVPTPYLEKILQEADEEIARGDVSGPFTSADEAIAHLRSL